MSHLSIIHVAKHSSCWNLSAVRCSCAPWLTCERAAGAGAAAAAPAGQAAASTPAAAAGGPNAQPLDMFAPQVCALASLS